MAGMKGRSGGPRANSGGARPGAGRAKRKPVLVAGLPQTDDPLVFLLALMTDTTADIKTRLGAAVACMPYCHAKPVAGVKDGKADAAKKASTGKFSASRPPVRLVT